MKLDKAIIDKIAREYSFRQNIAESKLILLKEELYDKYPKLKESINELNILYAKKTKLKLAGITDKDIDNYIDKLVEHIKKYEKINNEYLAKAYTCSKCLDTGLIDGDKCECYYKILREIVYKNTDLYLLIESQNMKKFNISIYDDTTVDKILGKTARENIAYILEDIKEYVANIDRTHFFNIFLTGNVGSGKTYLSSCIANELINKGYYVEYISANTLKDRLLDFSDNLDKIKEKERLYNSDILIIDDLGTENIGDAYLAKFLDLINLRNIERKPIIITTNCKLKEIKDIYSERFTSRIAGSYRIHKLFTKKDLR